MTDDRETIKHFQQAVNMCPQQLESWLETEDSQAVGQTRFVRSRTSSPDVYDRGAKTNRSPTQSQSSSGTKRLRACSIA